MNRILVTEKASRLAVGAGKEPHKKDRLHASITVSIADQTLAAKMTREMKGALKARADGLRPESVRVVRVERMSDIDAPTLADAVVIVPVTTRNRRRLPGLVSVLREAGPLGVQLVWDGVTPDRNDVEQSIFVVLERARETRKGPPVILAKSEKPTFALRLAIQETRS